jgi:hypothetical protein
MKNDVEDPHMWILEIERLNREVGKCEHGTMRSQEQMQATILARLPKRRYESLITSLNGKIGREGMEHQYFISEITGHYEMFIEPFKGRIFKKEETKKVAIEIRSIWRSTRPADKTVGGNSKGSATSVESKGTRHGAAGTMKREMEAMTGMAMECKIHFLENASNVARSGTDCSTAKIKEAIREQCSSEWLFTKQETGRNQWYKTTSTWTSLPWRFSTTSRMITGNVKLIRSWIAITRNKRTRLLPWTLCNQKRI